MDKTGILDRASLQVLCDLFGYDEGRTYFFRLIGKEKELEKEYSYSKRYRMLKNLFNDGAVAKFRPEDQDYFNYLLLPPSFLHFKNIDGEIISHLEKIYLKNKIEIQKTKFSQIIMRDEKGFLLFLLKYLMKDEAKILTNDAKLGDFIECKNKIQFIKNSESNRTIGLIDKRYGFEFSGILNGNDKDFIGYIAIKNGEKDIKQEKYLALLQKELGKLEGKI